MAAVKLWANSADSHFIEPAGLWQSRLPKRLAGLVPRTEKDPDGRWETIHVDGQTFRRRLPSIAQQEFMQATVAAPGSRDVDKRLADLDDEGIWAELVFPSLGMWSSSFRTPELLREAMRVSNDWAKETFLDYSPRLIPTAQVSTLDIDDAVAELQRCAALGFKAVFLPV
ncbi:MAG: amidohydrolase family protein, partial [Mycobacterium sp.]